jgi:predicted phage terminase large subunit-like protein
MSRAKKYRVEYLPDGELSGLRWCDGSDRFIPASTLNKTVAFHDPALCEGKDSDYAAIVVCTSDMNGYLYCLDAYIEKVSPSRQIEQAFILNQKWNLDVLYLEENNFQGILKDSYRSKQTDPNWLRVKGVTQHHNKIKRIASLEPLVTNGQLLFNIDLNPRLISQLQLFPTSNDDGPDALHGAIEPLRKTTRYFQAT